jgi:hypothetical protein
MMHLPPEIELRAGSARSREFGGFPNSHDWPTSFQLKNNFHARAIDKGIIASFSE